MEFEAMFCCLDERKIESILKAVLSMRELDSDMAIAMFSRKRPSSAFMQFAKTSNFIVCNLLGFKPGFIDEILVKQKIRLHYKSLAG